MAHNYWTKEEVETVKKLRDSKMTLEEIAKVMGRSKNSVGAKIVKLSQKGIIAVKVQQWTKEHDANLVKYIKHGLSTHLIANKLNRSISAIVARKKVLKFSTEGDNIKLYLNKNKPSRSCPDLYMSEKMKGKKFEDVAFKAPVQRMVNDVAWS